MERLITLDWIQCCGSGFFRYLDPDPHFVRSGWGSRTGDTRFESVWTYFQGTILGHRFRIFLSVVYGSALTRGSDPDPQPALSLAIQPLFDCQSAKHSSFIIHVAFFIVIPAALWTHPSFKPDWFIPSYLNLTDPSFMWSFILIWIVHSPSKSFYIHPSSITFN